MGGGIVLNITVKENYLGLIISAKKNNKESNQNCTKTISYEMRLKECGLTTLKTMKLRGYQIEVFKILNGYENIERYHFFD